MSHVILCVRLESLMTKVDEENILTNMLKVVTILRTRSPIRSFICSCIFNFILSCTYCHATNYIYLLF